MLSPSPTAYLIMDSQLVLLPGSFDTPNYKNTMIF